MSTLPIREAPRTANAMGFSELRGWLRHRHPMVAGRVDPRALETPRSVNDPTVGLGDDVGAHRVQPRLHRRHAIRLLQAELART